MVRQLFHEKYGEHYTLPDSMINRIIQRFRNEHTILRRKGRVFHTMMKRAKACLSVEDGHFEHLL